MCCLWLLSSSPTDSSPLSLRDRSTTCEICSSVRSSFRFLPMLSSYSASSSTSPLNVFKLVLASCLPISARLSSAPMPLTSSPSTTRLTSSDNNKFRSIRSILNSLCLSSYQCYFIFYINIFVLIFLFFWINNKALKELNKMFCLLMWINNNMDVIVFK